MRTRSIALLLATVFTTLAAAAQPSPRVCPATPPLIVQADVTTEPNTPFNASTLASLRLGDPYTLPLTHGQNLAGSVTSISHDGAGIITVQGTIPADPLGAFSISHAHGQVSGGIWCSRGTYGIIPTGQSTDDGRPLVRIQEWAPGATVKCAARSDHDLIAPADTRLRRMLSEPAEAGFSEAPSEPPGPAPAQGACTCGDDQATIDVMFVYTTLAKNAAGGAAALQARVTDAVASCNLAYSQSGINGGSPVNRLQVRAAGFTEISYDEVAPAWLDHLARLANPTDGFVDNAITLRDQFRADTVCLIVDDARFTGGAGYYAVYVRDSAAKVLNWRGMGGGSLTFAHELGHNLGCAHDRGNSSFSLFTYAWGHWFTANSTTYGTIMSYTGNVPVPMFSNPAITHSSGQPIGIGLNQPLPSFNALAITQTRWTLANYADSGRITDCNNNGFDDSLDISEGRSQDTNSNCRPDECEYRVYVDAGNTGPIDGLSWNTAYRDLAEAMAFASLNCSNVSEIWVADGMYRPDRGTGDRYAHFELRGGLALYGGFQGKSRPGGGETSITQRIMPAAGPAFPSILTGDIGTPGVHTDNCYNVLTALSFGTNALLDGFVIEHGYQDFDGAGIWVSNASPTIRHCVFRNNRGGSAAAINTVGSSADPTISDCIFENNTALWSGGCVGITDGASATFERCAFRTSHATYGGAASLSFGASATFRDCAFSDNTASENSGAIDCYVDNQLTLLRCDLQRNLAINGSAGAVLLHTNCVATITESLFVTNTAAGTGGGLWLQASFASLSSCELIDNTAGDGGGAISAYESGSISLSDCTLTDNSARWGGAMALGAVGFNIRNSTLHHNAATDGNGGALDVFGAMNSTIVSSALTANSCTQGGAAISLGSGGSLSIVNATIAHNRADQSGGGIAMFNAVLTGRNLILWGNSSGSPGSTPLQDQQLLVFSGSRAVSSSCVQGLTGSLGGTGNIGSDPRFADPAAADFGLLPGSPCIDSGNNSFLPVDAVLDLRGNPRRADDPDTSDTGIGSSPIVDRGAIEFTPGEDYCPADFNQDGGIDGADVEAFFVAWEAGDPSSDVNQDGGIDGADVETFFAAWEAGGCG